MLSWRTYLGGTGQDTSESVAVDSNGNVYVMGHTRTSSGATVGAYDTTLGGTGDAYVAKFNSSGAVQYITYIGGSGIDYGYNIAVDGSGQAYIAGETNSTDLTIVNGLSNSQTGYRGYIFKLNAAGSSALFSSYMDTTSTGYLSDLAVTNSGIVYAAGANNLNSNDVFVEKLDTTKTGASSLVWSTSIVGSGADQTYGLAIDGSENVYVVGQTASSNIAGVNAYDSTANGSNDAFLARWTSAGTLNYFTYFGGTGSDWANGVAVDSNGYVYVTGATTSSSGIASTGAYDTSFNGTTNAFLAKFDLTLSGSAQRVFATYYGNSGSTYGNELTIDPTGNAIVVGETTGTISTSSDALQSSSGGGTDAFVAKFNTSGTTLLYGSYMGGSSTDAANAVAIDSSYNLYVVGDTTSSGLATAGAVDTSVDASGDGFVAKLAMDIGNITVSYQEGSGYSSTQDTYIDSGATNTSYGNATTVSLDDNTFSNLQQGLIRFDNLFGTGSGQIRLDRQLRRQPSVSTGRRPAAYCSTLLASIK